MPLVSLNTVNRWYRKDSWVYKNFTYLFKNPLWDTSVPSGFSLCPYFWLALFAMTIFRVFVGAVLLIRWLFTPFGGLLKWTDSVYRKFMSIETEVPGIPTFFGTLLLACIGLLLFLATWGGHTLIMNYKEASALAALYLPIGLLAVAIPCWTYYSNHKNEDDRCKVENYLRIASIIAVGTAAYLMPEQLQVVVMAPLHLFREMLSDLFHFLFVYLPVNIWHGIVFAWHYGIRLLYSTLIYVGYCIVVLGIMGVFGLIADRLYLKSEAHLQAKERKAHDKEVDERAGRILSTFSSAAYYQDGNSSRTRDWWKGHIHGIAEAVALAYEIARAGRDVTDEDLNRAAKAALNTVELEAKLKAEREEARHIKCNKVTKRVEAIFKYVSVPSAWLWEKFLWTLAEFWTLVCLLFSLLKAKKQGACPYLRFTDPTPPAVQGFQGFQGPQSGTTHFGSISG